MGSACTCSSLSAFICSAAHSSEAPCDLEVALSANHIEVNNEQRSSIAVTEELVSCTPPSYLLLFMCPCVCMQAAYSTNFQSFIRTCATVKVEVVKMDSCSACLS